MMEILTFQFVAFFLVVSFIYFIAPVKLKNPVLIAASSYFLVKGSSWSLALPFMALSVFINFYSARFISAGESSLSRRVALFLAILFNLSPLIAYKLAEGVFESSVNPYFGTVYVLGLSYVTFSQIGYIADVYRKKIRPERSIVAYSVFVLFFPKIVAGPIERASGFLGQARKNHRFSSERVSSGLKLVLWGAFKKVVVSGFLAVFVDFIFADIPRSAGLALVIAIVFFAFQVYYDFSGYTDIALGSAQVLGFRLSPNFSLPYLATSVSEFWRRWHMTLSFWVRDYIYIPLGGSRVSEAATYLNLCAAFAIIGLWHGFRLTFIVWGLLNALFIIIALITRKQRSRIAAVLGLNNRKALNEAVSIVLTFSLICITWIFFRAGSMGQAFAFLRGLFSGWGLNQLLSHFGPLPLALAFFAIIFTEAVHLMQRRNSGIFSGRSELVRWPVYIFAVWMIVLVMAGGDGGDFIYQRF